MSVTDSLVRNSESYSKSFAKGSFPMPPAKHETKSRPGRARPSLPRQCSCSIGPCS